MGVGLTDITWNNYVPTPKLVSVDATLPLPPPASAPAPAPITATSLIPSVPLEPPTPLLPHLSNSPAPIPASVQRELEHEGCYKNAGGNTRGISCPVRCITEFPPRYGLLSTTNHAAIVSMLATRQSIDEDIRMLSAPYHHSSDHMTVPASDLPQ